MTKKFLTALILNSEAPEKLAEFYRDILELPFTKRGADEFSCMLGDTHFAIHKLQMAKHATKGVEIGLYISDLDNFVKKLEGKRAEIVDPIKEYPWARSAQVKDPEGNVIYLMQLPEASLQEIKKLRDQ